MERVIPLVDGECSLCDSFLDAAYADQLFAELRRRVCWHRPQVTMFGRTHRSPRLAAWYGDAHAVYTYSRTVNRPLPWFDALGALRRRLQRHCGQDFNGVLINRYRDGADAMGWHADDEPEIVARATIASLSLGATRRFRMRHRRRADLATITLPLSHGSLLLMRGETQRHWRHAVPPTRHPVGERINLTFRLLADG